ncbi:hypothetical protein [Geodermatophilus sp. SYSU D01105]
MTEGRRRLRWGLLVVPGAAAGTFVGGLQQAVRGLVGGEPWNWAEMAVYGWGWALLAPPTVWLVRRAVDRGRLPQNPAARVRARQSTSVAPAMRSGVLPSDADPDVWRRALRAEVREWNSQRWLAVAFAVVGVGVIGAAAIVANDNAWGVGTVAIVVTAEGVAAHRWSGRRLRTARGLQAGLRAREERPGAGGGHP